MLSMTYQYSRTRKRLVETCTPISHISWEDLPPPLLELILEQLPVSDYLRFAAVCTPWRQVQNNHRLYHASSPRPKSQIPWLMLPQNQESSQKLLFYNPSEQRYYNLSLSTNHSKSYLCGTSHGWLMLLDTDKSSLFLVNPFTRSEIEISIPRTELPNVNYKPMGMLSSVPTDPNCIVRLWDVANANQFYCCASNKNWVIWKWNPNFRAIGHFSYPVIWQGKFYCMFGPSLDNPLLILDDRGLPTSASQWQFLMEYEGQMLLTVVSWINSKCVKKFDVLKWDPSKIVWVQLKSLGDRVLFLCRGNSFGMSAADIGGPRDRIYLTWTMDFFDEEEGNQGQMWMEYDYASHLVINSKLEHSKEHESLRDNPMCWLVPSLRYFNYC